MKQEKKQTSIKNKLVFVALLSSLLAIALSTAVFAAYTGASIVRTDTGAAQNVYYYTSGSGYKDNVGNTPDTNITVCADGAAELTTKKVAAFYLVGANDSSLLNYSILGGDAIARFISLGSPYASGGGFCASANFEFFAGRSPYPGAVYAVVDTNNNNAGDTFEYGTDVIIPITTSNGYLRGSYSFNNVQSTYDQTTGNVNVDATGATAYTGAASTTSPSQTSESKLMLGVCTDSQGYNCSGTVRTTLASGSESLFTGVTNPPDTATYTRYAVANGLGSSFCIGPDLDITSVSASPSTGPPGTSVNLSAPITNQNTVDVTQSYTVSFYDGSTFIASQTLTGLNDGQSKQASVIWDTTGITSGSHTIYARLDDSGIGDCNNANDNASGTFTTELVYLPYIWIDGVQTAVFNDSGRPYNVTVQINDSNGNPSVNTTVKITEENGISLLAPIQTFTVNGEKKGVSSLSSASVTTDANGTASFTLIPTGNKLYTASYSYTNLTQHLGNYSLYLEIFNTTSGTELQLYHSGQKVGQLNLTLQDLTARIPNSSEQYSLTVRNQNSYIETILTFAYQVHATARRWMS